MNNNIFEQGIEELETAEVALLCAIFVKQISYVLEIEPEKIVKVFNPAFEELEDLLQRRNKNDTM